MQRRAALARKLVHGRRLAAAGGPVQQEALGPAHAQLRGLGSVARGPGEGLQVGHRCGGAVDARAPGDAAVESGLPGPLKAACAHLSQGL